MKKNIEQHLIFANREAWRGWLEEHHATEREAWLIHYKKNATKQALTYEEAVEEALCFGWIDGLLRSIDSEKFALRYSPRKSSSIWSVSNIQRVEKLTHEGRMTPAGLAKVAEAKENGEWQATTDRENIDDIPTELAQELKKNRAWTAFKKWPASRQKQYLYWLSSAKRLETQQKRIQVIVEMVKNKKS